MSVMKIVQNRLKGSLFLGFSGGERLRLDLQGLLRKNLKYLILTINQVKNYSLSRVKCKFLKNAR